MSFLLRTSFWSRQIRQTRYTSHFLALPCANIVLQEQTRHYVDATVKEFGQLDISIQNAGTLQERAPIEDTDVEVFDRLMRVNVRSREP